MEFKVLLDHKESKEYKAFRVETEFKADKEFKETMVL